MSPVFAAGTARETAPLELENIPYVKIKRRLFGDPPKVSTRSVEIYPGTAEWKSWFLHTASTDAGEHRQMSAVARASEGGARPWLAPTRLPDIPDQSQGERWQPPQKPRFLYLDGCIRDIERGDYKIKLRSRRELEQHDPLFCPYRDTRLYVLEAYCRSQKETADLFDMSKSIEALKKINFEALKSEVLKLSLYMNFDVPEANIADDPMSLTDLLMLEGQVSALGTIDADRDELFGILKDANESLLPFYSVITRLGAFIEKRREKMRAATSGRGDRFRQFFVEHLGYYFYFLTGELPTPENVFRSLVEQIYLDIFGISRGDVSARSQIETVADRFKHQPTGAGFDRYGKVRPRPGIPV